MQPKIDKKLIERREEEKLKLKYPNLGRGGGGSGFLNKRLQKGGVSMSLKTLPLPMKRIKSNLWINIY